MDTVPTMKILPKAMKASRMLMSLHLMKVVTGAANKSGPDVTNAVKISVATV